MKEKVPSVHDFLKVVGTLSVCAFGFFAYAFHDTQLMSVTRTFVGLSIFLLTWIGLIALMSGEKAELLQLFVMFVVICIFLNPGDVFEKQEKMVLSASALTILFIVVYAYVHKVPARFGLPFLLLFCGGAQIVWSIGTKTAAFVAIALLLAVMFLADLIVSFDSSRSES
jgi:hypothetical protein